MNDLDFLDIITMLSFALQIQNQKNIIGIADVQGEVNRAVEEIHGHLEKQDQKLDELLRREYEDNKKAVKDDRVRGA